MKMGDTNRAKKDLIKYLMSDEIEVTTFNWKRDFDTGVDENFNKVHKPLDSVVLTAYLKEIKKPIKEQAKEAVERGKERQKGNDLPDTISYILTKKKFNVVIDDETKRKYEETQNRLRLMRENRQRYLDLVDRVTKIEVAQANLEKKVKELESRSPFYLTYTYTMPNYSQGYGGSTEYNPCINCPYKDLSPSAACVGCIYNLKETTCGGKR